MQLKIVGVWYADLGQLSWANYPPSAGSFCGRLDFSENLPGVFVGRTEDHLGKADIQGRLEEFPDGQSRLLLEKGYEPDSRGARNRSPTSSSTTDATGFWERIGSLATIASKSGGAPSVC